MLWIVEKAIRGGRCYAMHSYANPNYKCIKNYDKNEDLSYLM